MADTTTYTGGTTSTTGTPSVPDWLSNFNQTGANAALAAAQTNPYSGLQKGIAGLNSATQATVLPGLSGIAGYMPQQVGVGNVAQYAGGTGAGGLGIAGMDLSGYQNPYTQSVINQSNADINRQSAITQQQNSGIAAKAGAFGGDRAAIVNTETQRNAADTMARTNAALYSQNFSQAQTAAQSDLARQLQAGTTQAQLAAQIGQGNQYAGLQAQNLNMSALGAMQGIYNTDQATRQKELDAQYEHDTNNALYPSNNASWLLTQGQKLPYSSYTTNLQNSATTGTATPPSPSTAAQLVGGLSAGAGLVSAIGGAGGLASGLASIGSGVSKAYDWLSGGSSVANAAASYTPYAVAAPEGLAATADYFNSAGQAAGDFAANVPYYTAAVGLARGGIADYPFRGGMQGGIAGYAYGGDVQGDYDDSYTPIQLPAGADGRRWQANVDTGMRYAAPQGLLDALAVPPPEGADPLPQGNQGADDPENLPVPPIPPAGGAPQQNVSAPINMPVQPAPAMPTQALTVRPMMQQSVPQPRTAEGVAPDGQYLPTWMALLKGGAAMMASKSPSFGQALGEGLGAGAEGYAQAQAQQQRGALLKAQLDQKAQYQTGQLQNGAARVVNGAAGIQQRANAAEARDGLARDRMGQQDAQFGERQGDLQGYRAARLGQTDQRLATQEDQGNARIDQGDRRLATTQDQFNRRLDADQGYRAAMIQLKANAAEDGTVKSIMFGAAQNGRTVTPADALMQARSGRQGMGPAPVPVPTRPTGVAALRDAAAPSPSPPARVTSRAEALALPPGTKYIGPDGLSYTRGGQ